MYLNEGAAWMVQASQCYQMALENPDCLIHMQPMKINLLQHKAEVSAWSATPRQAILASSHHKGLRSTAHRNGVPSSG